MLNLDNGSLINIEGTGMVGVPGTASRIFGRIRDAGVNVIMISQGSSEHSVCFAVKGSDADLACSVLKEEFAEYIQSKLLDDVTIVPNCTILAAVGLSCNCGGNMIFTYTCLCKINASLKR